MGNKTSLEQAMEQLKTRARPDQLAAMARYALRGENRLGVPVPELRGLAKRIGKDHALALELWATGVPDAMILAAMVDEPVRVTEQQMEDWVKDIESWDVCDQLCMDLFDRVPFALKKIEEWSVREEEFVRRAAFSLIACLAWHNKGAPDEMFTALLPTIKRGATDQRNFVKKAVNWALRTIGKRNISLNEIAISAAKEIQQIDSAAARWIAADAIRELRSESVQKRLNRK